MTERRSTLRFIIVAVCLHLALLSVAARLAYLHLKPDGSFRKKIEDSHRYRKEILGGRGRIHEGSAEGNILALNLPVKDVCADPAVLAKDGQAEATAARLARDLELDPAIVTARLTRPDRRFEYVCRFAADDKALQVEKMKIPGVFFRDMYARYYPHGSFMCHVLGFANDEGVGSAGVEQILDEHLKGYSGYMEGEVDARRREIYVRRTREVPAQSGADVYLTLDQNIQYILEQTLEAGVRKNQAKGGWGIVQRVRTGEILAMASLPAFDLNDFRASTTSERLNRSTGVVYEPGSTLKPVAISAALNEGIVTPSTVFDCENGAWLFQGKVLRDYHPYGNLCVADIIKKSSNIGTAKVALMLGDERLGKYLKGFGFGGRLGIDLPGEETGILHPVSRWSRISITRIGMGQGIAVTSLQMMGLFCAIANEGFLMRPYVVKRIVRSDGKVLLDRQPEVLGRPISGQTAAVMRELLARVTEEGGTGKKAGVEGFRVAGKTGTAQKPINGVYSESAYVSSFVGFLPAEAPEIGIAMVIDEPQPLHTGGAVAAPLFGEVAEQVVRYMDILPAVPMVAARDLTAARGH